MIEFSDDVDPASRDERVVLRVTFSVEVQRRLVEAECKGPAFRMWLTPEEYRRAEFADWTAYPLQDGRIAVWRPQADLDKLQAAGEMKLWAAIRARLLADDVE